MTQETRKDPRAKVLTMTVRYKSATLDEFIEHHSHDVSRGGMFIKTPSPFPPGTLLKFEVKISGEQRVMQGVGRVVWKRESSEISDARPAGMGVKFIKIDDESRKVIDQLVSARGDGASAFEQGAEGIPRVEGSVAARMPGGREIHSPVVAPSISARDTGAPSKPRKATMIGLGAMQSDSDAEESPADAFFPPTTPEQDMPPPEDRTVMKQAAELLQDALREAGGSLDEVGSTQEAPAREVPKAEPVPAPPPKIEAAPTPAAPATTRAADKEKEKDKAADKEKSDKEKSVIVNSRPREEVTQPAVRRASVAPAPRRSEPPRPRSAAIQEAAGVAAESGGNGRFLLVLVAVAAAAAVVFFLRKPAETPPEPAAEPPKTEAQPTPEPTPPPTAEAQPAAEPTGTNAATPSAGTPSTAAPSAVAPTPPPVAPTPAPVPVKPEPAPPQLKPVPAPKPAVKPVPAPKPAPVAPAAPSEPTAPTPPADAQPAPDAPVKPVPAPKLPKAPKPAPKPAEDPGDNPY